MTGCLRGNQAGYFRNAHLVSGERTRMNQQPGMAGISMDAGTKRQ